MNRNLCSQIPEELPDELVSVLVENENVKIERIVSDGHISPSGFWYDQEQDECVMVLQGSAVITFEDSTQTALNIGDHLNIPAHTKHKVSWTDPKIETIWLAVHY